MSKRAVNVLRNIKTFKLGGTLNPPMTIDAESVRGLHVSGNIAAQNVFEVTGNVALSGAIVSACQLTASTTTNPFSPDVGNTSVLWVSASQAACVIEGFTNGQDGQILHVAKTGAVGSLITFEHLEIAPGTEAGAPLLLPQAQDAKIKAASVGGGAVFVYRAYSATTNDGAWTMITSGGCGT